MEEVYDWTSHFKHLQSILIKFHLVAILTESIMVKYFVEGLKPFITTGMDRDATHLDDYKELIAKVVKAEVKADLWLNFNI